MFNHEIWFKVLESSRRPTGQRVCEPVTNGTEKKRKVYSADDLWVKRVIRVGEGAWLISAEKYFSP